MKNLFFITAILLTISNFVSRAQETDEKVVINTKMIEHFNNLEVDEDFITFNELVQELSFDEMKMVITVYYTEHININSRSEVYKALQQQKAELKESENSSHEIRLPDNDD
jgi:hypothetical protein